MANPNENPNETIPREIPDAAQEAAAKPAGNDTDAALDSFLSREQTQRPRRTGNKRFNRSMIVLLSAVIVIAVLVGVIITVNQQPYPASTEEDALFVEARAVPTVNESGLHTVEVPTTPQGEPEQNGTGTLLTYTPSELSEVRVENESGAYTVLAHTDAGEATEYTLKGYESFNLRAGSPDAVANDVCQLSFLTVAGIGSDLADYGLDHPRAIVTAAYTDGTASRIRVGNEAPASAGVYVAFGDSDTVYLVASDAVDSFFYTPASFIDPTITKAPASADASVFQKLTISGTHYPETIVLEPNTDDAVAYDYRMTAPRRMYTGTVLSSDIAGSIRDLYAEEVVDVNPGGESAADFLAPYGLSGSGYASVIAEYPDTVIRLRCSKPDADGSVFLVNNSDGSNGERVVYRIQLGALSWANASVGALAPDTILRVNRPAVSNVTVTAGGQTYSIDVDTKTQTVPNTDGETEEVTTTEAYLDGKRLDADGFTIFFQNLAALPNTGDSSGAAGDVLAEIRYRYATGREPDVITVYDGEGNQVPVALNGQIIGSTKKAYVNGLRENLTDLLNGALPKNL